MTLSTKYTRARVAIIIQTGRYVVKPSGLIFFRLCYLCGFCGEGRHSHWSSAYPADGHSDG
jgi:hypothetical protein